MLKVQCKQRYYLLKLCQFNAYKNVSWGLQQATSRVRDITNPDIYINPGNMQQRGQGHFAFCSLFNYQENQNPLKSEHLLLLWNGIPSLMMSV